MSLERLVSLAARRDLLDDWRYVDGSRIQLCAGSVELTLEAAQARFCLRCLIRRYDLVYGYQRQEQDFM